MKKAMAVANINFRNSKLSYFIFLITVVAVVISTSINIMVGTTGENTQISPGSYIYLLVLLFAIFVPALLFRRFMSLNVKKNAYIKGCAVSYVLLALGASVFNLISYVAIDWLFVHPPHFFMWNLLDIFGWSRNGLAIAFLQQFAFLLLVAAVAHTLTTIQTFWYGWLTDVVIVAIISVFTPIPPLRAVLVAVFNTLIFTPNYLLQIAACLGTSVVVYLLSIPAVKQKPV